MQIFKIARQTWTEKSGASYCPSCAISENLSKPRDVMRCHGKSWTRITIVCFLWRMALLWFVQMILSQDFCAESDRSSTLPSGNHNYYLESSSSNWAGFTLTPKTYVPYWAGLRFQQFTSSGNSVYSPAWSCSAAQLPPQSQNSLQQSSLRTDFNLT